MFNSDLSIVNIRTKPGRIHPYETHGQSPAQLSLVRWSTATSQSALWRSSFIVI